MINKHTADCDPSPSELPSRIHPLIYLWTPKGVGKNISDYLLRTFLEFFLKLVYRLWLQKIFKFMVFRLLVVHLRVKKFVQF